MNRVLLTLALTVGLSAPSIRTAQGHAFDPNILQLNETATGKVRITWTTSTPSDESQPLFPARCATEEPTSRDRPSPSSPASANDMRRSTWQLLDCGAAGIAGVQIRIGGASAEVDTIVRLYRRDGSRWTTVARAGGDDVTIPDIGSTHRLATVRRYLSLGVEHIALGIDHLLFLVALWLLVSDRRALLWTITAFTVGHSITLALATLDVVTPRSAPVEVLIAVSIAVLARKICMEQTTGG